MSALRLDDLAKAPVWVCWRNEERDGKATKVPYAPDGKRARADDPTTWGTRTEAEVRAKRIVNGRSGGTGIILGIDAGGDSALGGVDLDTCIDERGALTDWADEVVNRFHSCTEVSPGGRGLKIFFLYRTHELPTLRKLMGTQHGRLFSRHTGEDHPPAIELHVSNRYFTVTGEAIDPALTELRLVEFADLEWLVKTAGPAFVGNGSARTTERGSRPRDQSRSGAAFRLGLRMQQGDKTFEQFCEAVRTDPETTDWYREKGVANDKRELLRIWEKAAQQPSGPPWKIDLRAPYDTARLMLEVEFSADGLPTLHRHRGGFYAWNGTAFPEATDAEIRTTIYDFLDQCVVTVTDAQTGESQDVPVKPNKRIVSDAEDALRAAALLPDTIAAPAWLDDTTQPEPSELTACANGLLHLPTRELLPHSPMFFSQNALDYAYDPAAPKPANWLAFLKQLWPDDAESIATLREIFGYCLTPDTTQQKAFLIVGPKRSGKGTIARVLRRLIGAVNTVAPTLAGLGTQFGLQPLIGRRAAIISDARLGRRADQHAIAERLLSVTGEDALTIDRKYKSAWTGKLDVRFLVLTNELPRLADTSGALASRFIVLMLTESFYGREDKALTDKLLAELPGILNWSIDGWRLLRRRGYFVQPASAEDAIEQLENLGSPVGAFVRERCEVGPGKRESADRMFREWGNWCAATGRKVPGTTQTFGRDLRAAVPGLQTRRSHHPERRFYEGVALRPL